MLFHLPFFQPPQLNGGYTKEVGARPERPPLPHPGNLKILKILIQTKIPHHIPQ
jgi:hypothetical protein